MAHVLPVARFLQEVGAKRAQIAHRVAATRREAMRKAEDAGRPAPTEESFQRSATAITRSVMAKEVIPPSELDSRGERRGDGLTRTIRNLMTLPVSELWYQGVSVSGGDGWFNQLTKNATDTILYKGIRLLVTHFVDTIPVPPSPEETEVVRIICGCHACLRRYLRSTYDWYDFVQVAPSCSAAAHAQTECSRARVRCSGAH